MAKLTSGKFKRLLSKMKPYITLTNILLFIILITILKGFYISSQAFRFYIDNFGYSSKTERVGTATLSCTYGKLSKEEYEKKIDELDKQIAERKLEVNRSCSNRFLPCIDFEKYAPGSKSPEDEKNSLEMEGYLTTNIESVDVIRTRKFKFGFMTKELFSYAKEEPKDNLYRKCKCEGMIKNGLCEWKPFEKPLPYY